MTSDIVYAVQESGGLHPQTLKKVRILNNQTLNIYGTFATGGTYSLPITLPVSMVKLDIPERHKNHCLH